MREMYPRPPGARITMAEKAGDFLVQRGFVEKKDFLRKKEKEEKSKAKPLI